MAQLPDFDADGLLPPGDYEMSFEDLKSSPLVLGPANCEPTQWDSTWRRWLVTNLATLTEQLWRVGVREVFADGSFAEEKSHPNDIDGYFVCDFEALRTGTLQRKLNLLDPFQIWTWDPAQRSAYRGYPKKQLPMWHKYRVELYPHVPGLGVQSGIRDRMGNELEFPAAFRQSRRNGKPRGIIKIRYGGAS